MEIENVYVVIDNEIKKTEVIKILIDVGFSKNLDWNTNDLTVEQQKEYWGNKIQFVDGKQYLVYEKSQWSWFFINANDLLLVRYENEVKRLTKTEITIIELQTILNK
jgi:hypothetical protein